MFSENQLIFAVLFAIAFVAIIIVSYRKDKKLHKKHYKGTIWVLLGFLAFIALLLLLKSLLRF